MFVSPSLRFEFWEPNDSFNVCEPLQPVCKAQRFSMSVQRSIVVAAKIIYFNFREWQWNLHKKLSLSYLISTSLDFVFGVYIHHNINLFTTYIYSTYTYIVSPPFFLASSISLAKALPRRAQRIARHGGDDQSQSRPQAEHWRGSLEKKWRLCGYATYNCRGLRVGISPTKHGNILKAHLW